MPLADQLVERLWTVPTCDDHIVPRLRSLTFRLGHGTAVCCMAMRSGRTSGVARLSAAAPHACMNTTAGERPPHKSTPLRAAPVKA